MQAGWLRRRALEAEIGRQLLRRASRKVKAQRYSDCGTDEECLAYIKLLARRGTISAREELAEIIATTTDELHFAARVAFTRSSRQGSAVEGQGSPDVHGDAEHAQRKEHLGHRPHPYSQQQEQIRQVVI